jgi:hypothetical protein
MREWKRTMGDTSDGLGRRPFLPGDFELRPGLEKQPGLHRKRTRAV